LGALGGNFLIMKTQKYYRPRVQRAFLRWYELNRDRFPAELQFVKRTDRCLKVTLPGLCPLITFDLLRSGTYFEFNPTVTMNDDSFDLLLWLDVSIQNTKGGYICRMCQDDRQKLYQTREQMWADHLFEELLMWINKSLLMARWLIIDEDECGISVRLSQEKDEKFLNVSLWDDSVDYSSGLQQERASPLNTLISKAFEQSLAEFDVLYRELAK